MGQCQSPLLRSAVAVHFVGVLCVVLHGLNSRRGRKSPNSNRDY